MKPVRFCLNYKAEALNIRQYNLSKLIIIIC